MTTVPNEYTLKIIADTLHGELAGDETKIISGVAPFETAGSNQITFAGGKKYLKRIEASKAGAILVPREFDAPGKNLIHVDNPQLSFIDVVRLFHPIANPLPGVDERAFLADDACIKERVFVGAFVTIGKRTTIGSGSIIQNGAYIGDDVVIGEEVVIFPNVTILDGCCIGNRVTIHSGSVIGSDGYGFVQDGGSHHKIPQIGIVQIDDDVEIGACNTIDRATFGRTWIQQGVKTDNLVHIAHNVVVGEYSLLVAQVGIAGSTTVGHHAIIAGQAGVSGHLNIGNHVIIGPQTGVAKSISDGNVVSSGSPAMPHKTWLRVQRVVPDLPDRMRKITELEQRVCELEEKDKAR